MIINRIYEHQNLLSLLPVSFLVGLRTYQLSVYDYAGLARRRENLMTPVLKLFLATLPTALAFMYIYCGYNPPLHIWVNIFKGNKTKQMTTAIAELHFPFN